MNVINDYERVEMLPDIKLLTGKFTYLKMKFLIALQLCFGQARNVFELLHQNVTKISNKCNIKIETTCF